MSKPLVFTGIRGRTTVSSQRDKIIYEIWHSTKYDGKVTEFPYSVLRNDIVAKDLINTYDVRRFATQDDAKQFCQDMYEGKVDLDALRHEIQSFSDERKK